MSPTTSVIRIALSSSGRAMSTPITMSVPVVIIVTIATMYDFMDGDVVGVVTNCRGRLANFTMRDAHALARTRMRWRTTGSLTLTATLLVAESCIFRLPFLLRDAHVRVEPVG